ncbi:protein MRG1 isoform X2 [Prunus dulcis]|uniref:protein MRG1 isoform X2 n=1 Tax=Prunus dulcis TaxID=3755 RepID=UPI001481E5CE|nr:protein MRG1 isoform X2 [Prunus dulcis]
MANSSRDDSPTDGDTSSGDAPPSNSSLYSEGEKILAYHGPRIYEAKVQKAELRKNEWRYFVHYLGWNKNWDEWVGGDRLLKNTEDNIMKQQALDKKQGVDKNTKSGRSAQTKPKSSSDAKAEKEDHKNNVTKGKKRKNDLGAELVKLPRSPTVDDILQKYLDYRTKKDGKVTDPVGEVLKGIRCYFDKALPVMLLYKKERKQYQETVVGDVSPSTIYGAEHLLRLFVKLPELLAYVNIEEETQTRLQQKLLDFLKFLQKNHSTFFLPAYDGSKSVEGKGKGKHD